MCSPACERTKSLCRELPAGCINHFRDPARGRNSRVAGPRPQSLGIARGTPSYRVPPEAREGPALGGGPDEAIAAEGTHRAPLVSDSGTHCGVPRKAYVGTTTLEVFPGSVPPGGPTFPRSRPRCRYSRGQPRTALVTRHRFDGQSVALDPQPPGLRQERRGIRGNTRRPRQRRSTGYSRSTALRSASTNPSTSASVIGVETAPIRPGVMRTPSFNSRWNSRCSLVDDAAVFDR